MKKQILEAIEIIDTKQILSFKDNFQKLNCREQKEVAKALVSLKHELNLKILFSDDILPDIELMKELTDVCLQTAMGFINIA